MASSTDSGSCKFRVSGRKSESNPATVPTHPNMINGKALPKRVFSKTPLNIPRTCW